MPPSPELVERVRDLYHKRVPDVRFLIPVINGLEKVTSWHVTPNLDNHKSLIKSLLIFCIVKTVSLEHDIKGEIVLKGIVRSKRDCSSQSQNSLIIYSPLCWWRGGWSLWRRGSLLHTWRINIKCIHTAPVMSSVSICLTFSLNLQQHDDGVSLTIHSVRPFCFLMTGCPVIK